MTLERPKIPNFNSFSTLMDRLTIEVVKKTIFEQRLESKDSDRFEKGELKQKIKLQDRIIAEIKESFLNFMLKAWVLGEYDVIEETRTFK